MSRLDWDYFPHIRDTIIHHVLTGPPDGRDATIGALRLTQRAVRRFVDRQLVKHAVFVLKPRKVYTYSGKVRLPFEDAAVAAQVRVLDVLPAAEADLQIRLGRLHSDIQFPEVRYARVVSITCERVLHKLVGENSHNLTVIYPHLDPLPRPGYGNLRQIGDPKVNVSRIIAVRPLEAPWSYFNIGWLMPSSAKGVELVLAIVGAGVGTSSTASTVPVRPPLVERVATLLESIFAAPGPEKDGSLTVVGFSKALRETAPGNPEDDRFIQRWIRPDADFPGCLANAYGRKLRSLSWQEWRDELSPEKWRLIESLPGVCWDTYTVRDAAELNK